MSTVAESALSYPKILKLSSDHQICPLEGFQPKLPVRVNLCASAR